MLNQQGLTMIEVLTVSIIVGIVASIATPTYISASDRAREAEVKTNVHKIHLLLEDYKIQSKASKPMNVTGFVTGETIPNVAVGLKSDIVNPFDRTKTGAAVMVNASSWVAANIGYVGYPTLANQSDPYHLHGFGKTEVVVSLSEGN